MKRKIETTTNRHEYHILFLKEEYPPYYEEGINMYPKSRSIRENRGYKHSNKQIYNYQRRMYRTWKHNRKTRYKR